jgi:hypothetical protein
MGVHQTGGGSGGQTLRQYDKTHPVQSASVSPDGFNHHLRRPHKTIVKGQNNCDAAGHITALSRVSETRGKDREQASILRLSRLQPRIDKQHTKFFRRSNSTYP